MMSEHTFHQQIMGEFWDDVNTTALKRLAEQYHEETDAADRRICTAYNERNVPMPETPEQRSAAAWSARKTREKLGAKALELGFSTDDWDRAIRSAAERLR